MLACRDNSLAAAVRELDRRPSMHPYARHKTKAGPIRHYPLGTYQGLLLGKVWLGMRNYGWRYFAVPCELPAKTKRRRYEQAILNIITDAWRC